MIEPGDCPGTRAAPAAISSPHASAGTGGTKITDAILETLAHLPALRDLVLWETAVTAGAMDKLKTFPALRYLDVDQTGVTPEALADFRAGRPEVRLPSDIWSESAGA